MAGTERGEVLVPLGVATKTVGLKGEFRVKPYNPDTENIETIQTVLIDPGSGPQEYAVQRARRVKQGMIVLKLSSVDDLQQAESIVGLEIAARRSDLQSTDEDEYYWVDLIGLGVVDQDGNELGSVRDILETGANDVLIVQSESGRELLLPYIDEVVREIDLELGVIRVRLIPGLAEPED